jgi:AcrR family transcriptional regulator
MSNITEKAILEAAEREFVTKGYDLARTTSIASSAGVTHSMLHYYFRTKGQLFDRIVSEKMEYISEAILAPFGNPELPLEERLRAGISNHFDIVASHQELPRFIINEMSSASCKFDEVSRNFRLAAAKLLESLQKALDESAGMGLTVKMDARELMIDIVSLNVFVFMALPLVSSVLGDFTKDRNAFLERRKAENIEIIMRRIKK